MKCAGSNPGNQPRPPEIKPTDELVNDQIILDLHGCVLRHPEFGDLRLIPQPENRRVHHTDANVGAGNTEGHAGDGVNQVAIETGMEMAILRTDMVEDERRKAAKVGDAGWLPVVRIVDRRAVAGAEGGGEGSESEGRLLARLPEAFGLVEKMSVRQFMFQFPSVVDVGWQKRAEVAFRSSTERNLDMLDRWGLINFP